MAQIEQSDKGGKKKKGAQKKMSIHVDFTPMVDMNMLLITFFMLCTTMIKSQTIKILLPAYVPEGVKYEKSQARADLAMTLILDTEYDENGNPAKDENGNTKHRIYYYEFGTDEDGNGVTNLVDANPYGQRHIKDAIAVAEYTASNNGEPQGIRKVLRDRNKTVMDKYDQLKEEYGKNMNKKQREEFNAKVLEIAKDTLNQLPTIIIKALPTSTYENVINAFDELELNKIRRYSFQNVTADDMKMLENFKNANPEEMKNLDLKKIENELGLNKPALDGNNAPAGGAPAPNNANPTPDK